MNRQVGGGARRTRGVERGECLRCAALPLSRTVPEATHGSEDDLVAWILAKADPISCYREIARRIDLTAG